MWGPGPQLWRFTNLALSRTQGPSQQLRRSNPLLFREQGDLVRDRREHLAPPLQMRRLTPSVPAKAAQAGS